MPATICRHIRTNGLRCGSPALRDKPYCFHHHRLNTQRRLLHIPIPKEVPETIIHSLQTDATYMQREPLVAEYYSIPKPGPVLLDFPPIEDRESIQVALSMIVGAMGRRRLDSKDATPILYALQIASANAAKLHGFREANAVTELTTGEFGDPLALDEDPEG